MTREWDLDIPETMPPLHTAVTRDAVLGAFYETQRCYGYTAADVCLHRPGWEVFMVHPVLEALVAEGMLEYFRQSSPSMYQFAHPDVPDDNKPYFIAQSLSWPSDQHGFWLEMPIAR